MESILRKSPLIGTISKRLILDSGLHLPKHRADGSPLELGDTVVFVDNGEVEHVTGFDEDYSDDHGASAVWSSPDEGVLRSVFEQLEAVSASASRRIRAMIRKRYKWFTP